MFEDWVTVCCLVSAGIPRWAWPLKTWRLAIGSRKNQIPASVGATADWKHLLRGTVQAMTMKLLTDRPAGRRKESSLGDKTTRTLRMRRAPYHPVAFEVPLLGWFPRAKWAQSSWGPGGRCKPPSGVWGSAPEAFENYAFFFPSFDHFHIRSLNFQLGLNCGVFQGQGFVDHKTRCPSRCQSASSRPLLAVLQYGVHLVNKVWLFRLSKRQKKHPFCHCIFVDPLFLMPCMRKCSCAENKRTKPRCSAQLYQKLIKPNRLLIMSTLGGKLWQL